MFGSIMLDVAIGLALIYLVLSFVCTAIREGLEGFLKDRAVLLYRGVCELLDGDDKDAAKSLREAFYEHPLINSLYAGSFTKASTKNVFGAVELPSYIPARSFALALFDMIVRGRETNDTTAGPGAGVLSITTLRQNISELKNPRVQRIILSALDTSGGDLTKAQESVEAWFNSSMDRVSGWYKRRTQSMLIVMGIAIAIIANVDTIKIAEKLYKNPGLRDATVAMATSVLQNPAPGMQSSPAQTANTPPATNPATTATTDSTSAAKNAAILFTKLNSLDLPIGWRNKSIELNADLPMTILGWLITGLAISLGAPFWFDLLSKFMSVRSSLKPAEKKPASTDTSASTTNAAPAAAAPAVVAPAPGGPAITPGVDYTAHAWSSGSAQAGVI